MSPAPFAAGGAIAGMVRLKDDVNHTSARAEETLMPSETSAIPHSLLRAICCLCIRLGLLVGMYVAIGFG